MADEQATARLDAAMTAASDDSEAGEIAVTIDEADKATLTGEVEASRVDALLIKNRATGDTLFINMDSGEGVFIEGQQAQLEPADGVVDEDVDLSFGSRKLEDTPNEPDAIPDLVGYLERWLLPERTAQHLRNFRRELLLAARSLLDAGIRGIERHDRAQTAIEVDADAPADYTDDTEAVEHEAGNRRRPFGDNAEPGLRRIELE